MPGRVFCPGQKMYTEKKVEPKRLHPCTRFMVCSSTSGTILVPSSKVELFLSKKVRNSSTLVNGAVLALRVEPFFLAKSATALDGARFRGATSEVGGFFS